jgi:hypothetical protein
MPLWDQAGWVLTPQRVAVSLWIGFLTAAVATGAFFSAIDPLELRHCVSLPAVGRTAAYTIGFLLFWLLTASSALIAVFFVYPGAPARGSATPAAGTAESASPPP